MLQLFDIEIAPTEQQTWGSHTVRTGGISAQLLALLGWDNSHPQTWHIQFIPWHLS